MTLTDSKTDEAAGLLYAAQEGRAPIGHPALSGPERRGRLRHSQVNLGRRLVQGRTVVGQRSA